MNYFVGALDALIQMGDLGQFILWSLFVKIPMAGDDRLKIEVMRMSAWQLWANPESVPGELRAKRRFLTLMQILFFVNIMLVFD